MEYSYLDAFSDPRTGCVFRGCHMWTENGKCFLMEESGHILILAEDLADTLKQKRIVPELAPLLRSRHFLTEGVTAVSDGVRGEYAAAASDGVRGEYATAASDGVRGEYAAAASDGDHSESATTASVGVRSKYMPPASDRVRPEFFMIDMTDKCNMACVYCLRDIKASGRSITDQVLQDICKYITVYCDREHLADVTVQPWGGEPLLNLAQILKLREWIAPRYTRVHIDLESNATLINPDIASKLCREHIGLGISIDGFPEVHDAQRQFPGGGATSAKVERGIACVRDAFPAEPGTITTITERNRDSIEKTLDYFAKVLHLHTLKINYVHESTYAGKSAGCGDRDQSNGETPLPGDETGIINGIDAVDEKDGGAAAAPGGEKDGGGVVASGGEKNSRAAVAPGGEKDGGGVVASGSEKNSRAAVAPGDENEVPGEISKETEAGAEENRSVGSLCLTEEEIADTERRILQKLIALNEEGYCITDQNIKTKILNLLYLADTDICLSRGCHGGRKMIVFDMDGNYYPCELTDDPSWKLGNIYEDPDLIRAVEKQMCGNPFFISKEAAQCRPCPWQIFCRGGCTVRVISRGERPPQIDSTECAVNRALYPELVRYMLTAPEKIEMLLR